MALIQVNGNVEYRIESTTLFVSGDLTEVLDMSFDLHVAELLDQEGDVLTLDLLGVDHIISQYLGALAAASMEASKRNKRLKVISTGKVAGLIELAGFDKILELEVR